MLNKFTLSVILIALTAFFACKDKITSPPLPNKAPTTKIFLDTVVAKQQSQIRLYWSGDDPDGTVIGFYFSWDGIQWTFTTKNDSLFALQIGVSDTVFKFRVSAVDNAGNGNYDTLIYQNGRNYGPEPFTDLNGNGKWDDGESFIDIGLIDPNPVSLTIPIKNTAPQIDWNIYSFHPDTSFPVMSFGWIATDLDGNTTVDHINIALNDTNNFVSLNSAINNITLRTKDFSNPAPLMDILIDGAPNNQPYDPITGAIIKIPGLVYNSNNIFYCQAVDISGAKSPWISSAATPSPSKSGWFVKKPQGKIIIVNDYQVSPFPGFYRNMMDSLQLSGKYDVYDLFYQKPPYITATFFETIKLFQCVIWCSDNSPSLNLAAATVYKYTVIPGNKIFFSMQFPQSVDLKQIQQFLPILPDSSGFVSNLLPGRSLSDTSQSGFPPLLTTAPLLRARTFYPSDIATPIYYLSDNATYYRNTLFGYVGFETTIDKNLFFISFPLDKLNGISGSVQNLLKKVLFQDFQITP